MVGKHFVTCKWTALTVEMHFAHVSTLIHTSMCMLTHTYKHLECLFCYKWVVSAGYIVVCSDIYDLFLVYLLFIPYTDLCCYYTEATERSLYLMSMMVLRLHLPGCCCIPSSICSLAQSASFWWSNQALFQHLCEGGADPGVVWPDAYTVFGALFKKNTKFWIQI